MLQIFYGGFLAARPITQRLYVVSSVPMPLTVLGPDLQNILRQSYDFLTIMTKLRSTYDGRLIYKTSIRRAHSFS